MKKFLFFVSFVLLAVWSNGSFAGCNSPVTLGFDGNQHYYDDEFLYETEEQYLLTQQGYENTGGQTSGDGKGYECDAYNSPSCTGGDEVVMPAGHVFEGNVINKRVKYRCRTGLLGMGPNDDWYPVEEEEVCATKGFGDIPVGKCVTENGKCKTLSEIDCSGYRKTDDAGTAFHGICRDGPTFVCKAIECRKGMHANSDGICVVDEQQGSVMPPVPPQPVPDPEPTKSCVQTRCGGLAGTTYSQCITCCYVPSSTAVWDSGLKRCVCTDNSKTFNPSTLQCETVAVTPPENEEEPYVCDPSKLELLSQWSIQYATNNVLVTQINQVLVYCSGTPSELVFNNMYNQILMLINQSEADAAASVLLASQKAARNRITTAANTIQSITSNLKLTVWKNEEGNFNTSRLLSDSIAGVVLGTAGGLITSSVVKKNQVESGFEDIQCTVGGQVVAGWGDEFRVGIQ